MVKDISLWQFGGFVFTAIGGTLLHFLYDWTKGSIFVAPFSGVNESTWEHMKLLYFPMLVFALIQSRFLIEAENFWSIKLIGIITGLVLIPILFYTYNGAFGKSPDYLNIAIFFICAAAAFAVENHLFKSNTFSFNMPKLSVLVLLFICVFFIIFTFKTPEIPLFQDPLTGTYGKNR